MRLAFYWLLGIACAGLAVLAIVGYVLECLGYDGFQQDFPDDN